MAMAMMLMKTTMMLLTMLTMILPTDCCDEVHATTITLMLMLLRWMPMMTKTMMLMKRS